MLQVFGKPYRHCDGISRRNFLTAGATGIAGLTLADLLRAEAQAGIGSSEKAVINIHLDGGPPQMDMFDMKPNAPTEIRGEFNPIQTKLSDLQICELMPRVATIADKFTFIRSLVGSVGAHDAFQCQTGYPKSNLKSLGGRPAMGCVISKLRGSTNDVSPSFVDMMQGRPLVRHSARPGFLGPAYKPFRPDMSKMFKRELEPGMKKELKAQGANHTIELKLNQALSAGRLNNRSQLLGKLDGLKRDIDSTGMMDALDRFNQQAVGILTSGRFADAMNLSKIDPATLARFTCPVKAGHITSDDGKATQKLLLARRLVEAGVRCVSVTFADFDTHSKNFPRMRQMLPIVDFGLHALITDLEQRGMLDNVSIVIWGEFGRTPRIDAKTGGRHHWPRVGPAMLAGGGMKVGQIIGSTDKIAGTATSRPVHYQDVFATLYHNMGINTATTTIVDTTGRPQYLLERGKVIREVV